MRHTITVEGFRPEPGPGMIPLNLADGALLVVERSGSQHVKVCDQTDDYDEAYRLARATAKLYGAELSVVADGVVVGHEVAALAICEAHDRYGDGTYDCPLTGAPRHTWQGNLAGYHPCNRRPVKVGA